MYVLFFLLFLYISPIRPDGLRCSQILGGDAFFTLETLSSKTDYTFNFTQDDKKYTLFYNFCYQTHTLCQNVSAYTILVPWDSDTNEPDFTKCIKASSNSLISYYQYQLIDTEDVSKGVQLLMTEGDLYETDDKLKKYETMFELFCDDAASGFALKNVTLNENELLVSGLSKNGCPMLQISAIYNFIVNNKYILALVMLLIGSIECFFGLAMLGPSLFTIGFVTGFGFLLLLFGEFIIKPNTSSYLIWTLIFICIVVGTCLGYLATSLPKIGFFALGIWLGVVIAFLINNLFLYNIETNPPDLLLYLLMLVLGASGAFLSKWKWKFVCIVSTSLLGAYMVIRAFSIFIGYYPDELTIAKKIRYKEMDGVGWEFYIYFSFIVVLAGFGIYVQFVNKKKGGRYNGDFGLVKDEDLTLTAGVNNVEMPLLENGKKGSDDLEKSSVKGSKIISKN